MAKAKGESLCWEMSPVHSKLHVAGQAGGSRGLNSQGHGKAKWEQPLVTLFRFENTTGGLKALQEEISCQV